MANDTAIVFSSILLTIASSVATVACAAFDPSGPDNQPTGCTVAPESLPGRQMCSDGLDEDCNGATDGEEGLCGTYANDFDTETDDFVLGKDWSMGPDYLSSPSCPSFEGGKLDGASWGDVVVTSRVRLVGSCGTLSGAGLTLREAGEPMCPSATGYLCAIDAVSKLVSIFELSSQQCIVVLAQVPAFIEFGTWYDMEFRAEGNDLECRLSGGMLTSPLVISATDSSHSVGTIGVGANDVEAQFDDLVATTPPR